MPTTAETSIHYLPRRQRYHYESKTPYLADRNTSQRNDSVVKSIDYFVQPIDVPTESNDFVVQTVDVRSLTEVPSKRSSRLRGVWITIVAIGCVIIVVAAITIPLLLIFGKTNTTSTTTATTSTTTSVTTSTTTSTTTSVTTSTTTSATTTNPYPSGITLLSPGTPLYTITSPSSSSSYFNVQWLYYAQSSTETISIGMQNNPSFTQIDDVSVLSGTQQLLCNGGFENASMICWSGTNHLSTNSPHTGSYCYYDGVVGAPDYVSQTFNTVPGALLYISFWIAWGGSGAGVYTNITIYP